MNRDDLTLISQFRQLTGVTLKLKRHEKILHYTVSPDAFMVQIETLDVQETTRETRYKRRGQRVLIIRRNVETDRWFLDDFMDIVWDDTFEPYVYRHFGRTETIEETRDRIDWQTICHRPGNDRFPLDSAKAIDPTISPKMENHYNK